MTMFPGIPVTPLDAIAFGETCEPNSEANTRQLLIDADVVFGHDWMTGHEFLLYGRDRLEKIIRSGVTEKCKVVLVGMDMETPELEKAVAVVEQIKGRCEYQQV